MKRLVNRALKKSFSTIKKGILSNKTLSNAIMDVYNDEEFSNLYEHEKMLADSIRIKAYKKAVDKLIKPGDNVVDLGTGTGILSFLAANRKPNKIYAIDHSGIINVAKEAAKRNGIKNIIFENVNSKFFNPPEKMDVILHEQIGDDLFDENMIENLMDLKKRVLKKDGIILPGKFELYLEPVSLKPDFRVPFIWDNKSNGFDFSFMYDSYLSEDLKNIDYRFSSIAPYSVDFFLCKPKPVLTIDLNNDKEDISFEIDTQVKQVIKSGEMDGICLYFKAIFDDEITFDTSPLHTKTSWSNRLFRTKRIKYETGQAIRFNIIMDSSLVARTWHLDILQSDTAVPV